MPVSRAVEITELDGKADAIAWCSAKNLALLEQVQSGTVICGVLGPDFTKKCSVNYIETQDPRRYFASVLTILYSQKRVYGISPTAVVAKGVSLPPNCTIGHHVVIEEGCVIGSNVSIGHNTVLLRNTVVGDNVSIGCNCTIGGTGFGYQKNEENEYELLLHIGNVVLLDNVEIGNNVCIDRAVLSSTILGRNVKVDNLVHIAHNVKIGENSLIIANSMIGGSTMVGSNVWVAPSASIINKVRIGDNATVGMAAVVVKDVEEGAVVFGSPAKPKAPSK